MTAPGAGNRAIIARTCGFPAGEWVAMRQVHGAHVAPVCHPTDGELEADAVMTERPDLVLTVATADCVPILLCDPLRPAVAAIHAGWRGTATHIVGRTITAMEQAYGTKRDQIVAVIGPAIESCCYSVDEDVSRHFEEWEGRGLWREGRRIRLSLPRIVRGQLLVAGIRNEHIVLVDRCVSCEEERFFSHRRDRGQTGRQWNFIMIHR